RSSSPSPNACSASATTRCTPGSPCSARAWARRGGRSRRTRRWRPGSPSPADGYLAVMADAPWRGDARPVVESFRPGERSPTEQPEASLAAIVASQLNAFAFLDADRARAAAAAADMSLPFGGVPIGVKELDQVEGWPDTHASVPLADRTAPYTSTYVARV